MSRCHRLTSYIEVLPQMENKYNHLAIFLACIKFNDRVYAIGHQFTNTKKCCKSHFEKCKFFKEKYGEYALAIVYESDSETTLQNQSNQNQKRKHNSKLLFFFL